MGISQLAVCRELQRNGASGGYVCEPAQEAAAVRRLVASNHPRKMTPQMVKMIAAMLRGEGIEPATGQLPAGAAAAHQNQP